MKKILTAIFLSACGTNGVDRMDASAPATDLATASAIDGATPLDNDGGPALSIDMRPADVPDMAGVAAVDMAAPPADLTPSGPDMTNLDLGSTLVATTSQNAQNNAVLDCPTGTTIASVEYAFFDNSNNRNSCAADKVAVVAMQCVGLASCTVNTGGFAQPCSPYQSWLSVEVLCR